MNTSIAVTISIAVTPVDLIVNKDPYALAIAADMLPSKRTVKKALNAEKGAFCMSRKEKISSGLKKKVVRMCKSGQVSQAEAARRCGVSESTIEQWMARERSEGCAGLEDRRGKRKYEQDPRTELEKAQIEIAQLKHQLQMAQWENRLLKKLAENKRSDALDK